ncbi:CRISPR-associated protein Cas5 [Aeropyrum pernix]|uniref:CRISPR-associated protein Cas5 n=1 Tax=Aeropyrum pernix TaxID=56636 RepID=UPI0013F1532D|nr:CRISPR-associated protein Cas5 [Aeropyrum pernix]
MTRVFAYARLRLHWGFIVRQPGASAAQTAYPLPPPTTVAGAFANPLARILGIIDSYPEKREALPVTNMFMSCVLKSTLAAAAGLAGSTGVAVYEEPSRLVGSPYKGGGSFAKAVKSPIYIGSQELLPVQAVGQASAPNAEIVLAWLFDLDRLVSCSGVGAVGVEDVEAASRGVYRLGSREGLASVVDGGAVDDTKIRHLDSGPFESVLYQDSGCVIPDSPVVEIPIPSPPQYRERAYLAPASHGSGSSFVIPPPMPARFFLKSGCRAALYPGVEGVALAYR